MGAHGAHWAPHPPTRPHGPPRFFREPSGHGSTRRKLRGQRNIPKTCSSGLSTGQKACTWGATTAYMLPEGDILPDLPLGTLELSGAHESSITSNDMFVVDDILLLYAAGFLKPSAFSHYRWIRAMVISIAIIPFLRMRTSGSLH